MKKRNYKRIYKPGTLMRIEGSNAVFMSLGLNPKNDRQIFSFNGIDIVERKTVKRADGKARPANKWEQTTYWAVMKEVVDKPDRYINSVWHSKNDKPDGHDIIVISDGTGFMACERYETMADHHKWAYLHDLLPERDMSVFRQFNLRERMMDDEGCTKDRIGY